MDHNNMQVAGIYMPHRLTKQIIRFKNKNINQSQITILL